jgi:putative two-component system response regulator
VRVGLALRDAAPLHDINKIGISERILGKPGRLSPEERTVMMQHVKLANIVAGARSPALRAANDRHQGGGGEQWRAG